MTLGLFFFAISLESCIGVHLSPLENNDYLKHIKKQFVAEWQWESWPIKQGLAAQDNQSPGARINVALWREPSGSAWYLFGGRPVDSNITKVYSDIWKYSVATRTWEMFYPQPSKNKNAGKTDEASLFRSDLPNEIADLNNPEKNLKIFLCGSVAKINATDSKKSDLWSGFYRRKKPEEEKKEELKSLAVYAPRTSEPSSVWQMDVKESAWTAHVCCCDPSKKENVTSKPFKSAAEEIMLKKGTLEKLTVKSNDSESSILDSKINKVEDEMDHAQEHLSIKNVNNKKKKINQYKKGAESFPVKVKSPKKRNVDGLGKNSNETKSGKVPGNGTDDFPTGKGKSPEDETNRKRKGDAADKLKNSKTVTKHCPENVKVEGEPVSWCDGKNGALITADVSLPHVVVLWVFNLWTSQWTKMEVKIPDHVEWSLCSDLKTIRYAETGEEVYLFCTPKGNLSNATTPPNDSTDLSGVHHQDNSTRKLVFRISYRKQILESLGEIRFDSYLGTPEGREVWQNATRSILQAVKNSDNETVLLLAYSGKVDLWILTGDSQSSEYFDSAEKIWRGSAIKWFDKYNAAFYNLQIVTRSGKSETILIRNPRPIAAGDYWGRERGRFIIRIFKNDHLKNQTFENRTREKNLTYELFQTDHKPSEVESQFLRPYSCFIIFGITLAIFKFLIFIVFVKRLVEKSRQMKIRGECRKSPLIIRYSVIPDDLLQPVT